MPKDYRKRKYKASRPSKSSSGFAWAVFGILIGVFLAAVFYWQKTTPSDSQHHVAPAKTTTTTTAKHAGHLAAATPKKSVAPAAPEFDFYTVLPKMQVTSNNAAQKTAPPPHRPQATHEAAAPTSALVETTPTTSQEATSPSPPEEIMPAQSVAKSTPATPTVPTVPTVPTSKIKDTEPTSYLLQMASLKSYADADRLKAQLTMLGFDVYIHSYSVNGQVYNRVLMGPYSSRSVASQQQAQLQKNHVPSILIKAPD